MTRKPEKNISAQVIGIKTMVMAGTIPASLKIWEEEDE